MRWNVLECLCAAGVIACGEGPHTHTITIAAPEPAPSASVVVAPREGHCELGPAMSSTPARASHAPPMPGQMTEEAAQAKRLFDREDWPAAITALARVADGATADDIGNRELAQYHVGIALYRIGKFRDAYETFAPIARNRNHAKNVETMLWLDKFARDQPDMIRFADFAFYDEQDLLRFDNAMQRPLYEDLAYLVGRAYLQTRELALAANLFARVPPDSHFGPDARACRGLLDR
jgi:hypothetical protein